MTYAIAPALQTAIYDALRSAPAVTDLAGDAIYDTIPPGARPELYVTLGPEQVRDRSDSSGSGALHMFVVSVVSDLSGFARAKVLAAAVSDTLHDADLSLARGALVFLNFDRARASKARSGEMRRIDLTFRARVCDGAGSAS